MKTLLINGSPKKKRSVSGFFLDMESLFIGGERKKETLRNKSDHERILTKLDDTDNVVFCLPLYVDGVPSHVLYFMKDMEAYCREKNIHVNIYVISNGGFIEGRQNAWLMQVFENFCKRSDNTWCGGIGIGGGVMLNVMRILLVVYAGILLLNIVINGVAEGNWLPVEAFQNFGQQAFMTLFFSCGVIFYELLMAGSIRKGKVFGVRFTRAMMPSFLFILVADIFFVITSIFQGGIFRGWLSKKE